MKKLLLGSVVLMAFAMAILLFEISCKKDAVAQTGSAGSIVQLNKIVYMSKHGTGGEIWMANYDGTNKTKVNCVLPSGLQFDFVYGAKLSPDGKKLFFAASNDGWGEHAEGIYSCNADGSNVTKIIDHVNGSDSLRVDGVY